MSDCPALSGKGKCICTQAERDARNSGTLSVDRRDRIHALEARNARLTEALREIAEVDAETNEALQSTCIDIARQALQAVAREQGDK